MIPPNAWHERATELAQWAMPRLVNRTDRCGRYYFNREANATRQCADPPKEEDSRQGFLTITRLVRHFKATETGAVVGVYSYGPDGQGKWCGIDIDNHDDKGDPLANERYAVHLARTCIAIGLAVLLYESNGKGGFHLWVLLDGAVPAAILRRLGNWLVRGHADHGFSEPPEVFPKNDGDTPWGNWLRLPGRHHTREIWPRVWNGEEWVSGTEAVAFVLSLTGCSSDLIPTAALTFGAAVVNGGSTEKPIRSNTEQVPAWEDFNTKASISDVVEILERNGWQKSGHRGDGAIDLVRPGKKHSAGDSGNVLVENGCPIFFCFTDAAPPLEPMKGYSPAALVAILDHRGDFKESNMHLYESGYGTRIATKEKPKPGPSGTIGTAAVAAKGPSTDETGDLDTESLVGITPRATRYLVDRYIPCGMIGMLAGEGGHGKSTTTLELAAALSVGRCAFGLTYSDPLAGKTLLISCEDDWERTIVPRLAAFGADLSRILRVKGVRMKKNNSKVLDFHLGHFRELERTLLENPDIKLVTIDPAGAYVGRSGVNENHDADLRAILGPLSEIANRTGTTVILIKHLNKSAGASAVQRVGGSAGYVNACRFAYLVAPDLEDKDLKLMLPIKANVLASGRTGLSYRMEAIPESDALAIINKRWPHMQTEDAVALAKQMFRQKWESGIVADADAVAEGKQKRQAGGTVQECIKFIRQFLGQYAWPDKELEDAAKKAGFSFTSIKNAKTQMRGENKSDPTRLSCLPEAQAGVWWQWIGSQYKRPPDRPSPCPSLSLVGESRESGDTGNSGDTGESKSIGCIDFADSNNPEFVPSFQSRQSVGDMPLNNKTARLTSNTESGVL